MYLHPQHHVGVLRFNYCCYTRLLVLSVLLSYSWESFIMNIEEENLLLAQIALLPLIGQTQEWHMKIVDFLLQGFGLSL